MNVRFLCPFAFPWLHSPLPHQKALLCHLRQRRIRKGIRIEPVDFSAGELFPEPAHFFRAMAVFPRIFSGFYIHPGGDEAANTQFPANRTQKKFRRCGNYNIPFLLLGQIPRINPISLRFPKGLRLFFYIRNASKIAVKFLFHPGFVDASQGIAQGCPALPGPIAKKQRLPPQAIEIKSPGAILFINGLIKIVYVHCAVILLRPALLFDSLSPANLPIVLLFYHMAAAFTIFPPL